MSIQRWQSGAFPVQTDDGPFVSYADHLAREKELVEALKSTRNEIDAALLSSVKHDLIGTMTALSLKISAALSER